VTRLPDAVVQLSGDDAIGPGGVGQVVVVPGVRRGGGLLLLGGDAAEGGVVDIGPVRVVRVVRVVVVTVALVVVGRDAVQPRAQQDGEQEPGDGRAGMRAMRSSIYIGPPYSLSSAYSSTSAV
jgi:hypothetical protein